MGVRLHLHVHSSHYSDHWNCLIEPGVIRAHQTLEKLVLYKISQLPQPVGPSDSLLNGWCCWCHVVSFCSAALYRCIQVLKSFFQRPTLDSSTISQLLNNFDELKLCQAQLDSHFVTEHDHGNLTWKGKDFSVEWQESVACINEVSGKKTVRTCDCKLLQRDCFRW